MEIQREVSEAKVSMMAVPSFDSRAQYHDSDSGFAGDQERDIEPQSLQIEVNFEGKFQPMPRKDVHTDKPGSVCRRISAR